MIHLEDEYVLHKTKQLGTRATHPQATAFVFGSGSGSGNVPFIATHKSGRNC